MSSILGRRDELHAQGLLGSRSASSPLTVGIGRAQAAVATRNARGFAECGTEEIDSWRRTATLPRNHRWMAIRKEKITKVVCVGSTASSPDPRERISVASRDVFVLQWIRRFFGVTGYCPSGACRFFWRPLWPRFPESAPTLACGVCDNPWTSLTGLGGMARLARCLRLPAKLAAAVHIKRRQRSGSTGSCCWHCSMRPAPAGGTSTRSTP